MSEKENPYPILKELLLADDWPGRNTSYDFVLGQNR